MANSSGCADRCNPPSYPVVHYTEHDGAFPDSCSFSAMPLSGDAMEVRMRPGLIQDTAVGALIKHS